MSSDAAAGRTRFLGIEGGATRTVVVLADETERLLARVEAGPANLRLMSDAELKEHLRSLAAQFKKPAAIGIGLAGLRTESDRTRVLRAAEVAWPGVPCVAVADLETAMAIAGPSRQPVAARVLVLSGTGSCCFGRALDGRVGKVGGWGHWLGDKGSGYEIGLRALKAAVHYYDVHGVWPTLGSALLRALQLNEPEDLVEWIQRAEKREIAALAVEVFEAWKNRDKIAADVLQGAAASLAKDAAACAQRLTRPPARVQFIFAGSVLLKQPRFARLVSKQLAERWPEAEVTRLRAEGALGAVRLARELWRSGAQSQASRVVTESGGVKAKAAAVRLPSSNGAPSPLPVATAMSPTEERNPASLQLDRMPLSAAIGLMLREESKVTALLRGREREIARCIRLIVAALRKGGRLFYVGAGTSGRLGALDASECPPTFRASPDQVQGIMAGGQQALWQSLEGAEDDAVAGTQAVRFRGVTSRDVVIGIAASGRTPFVWGALDYARRCHARTALVCFNPNWRIAPAHRPDVVIAVDLGPEVLTGSTRLKAGTATKLLLNMFTTLAMVQLGKVVSNLMVDLNPSNVKLRDRAVRIVRELTDWPEAQAKAALEQNDWVIKLALKNGPGGTRLRRKGADRP